MVKITLYMRRKAHFCVGSNIVNFVPQEIALLKYRMYFISEIMKELTTWIPIKYYKTL